MPDQPAPFTDDRLRESSAIETLVREAMAAGAAYFAEKAAAGQINPHAAMGDLFGDFPAEFIKIRSSLVADTIPGCGAAVRAADDDVVQRARHAIEHGNGDRLHRALLAALRAAQAEIAELRRQLDSAHEINAGVAAGSRELSAERDAARARIAELEERSEKRRIRLVAAEEDLGEIRGMLSPNGWPRRIPAEVDIRESVAPAVAWLLDRVAELETEQAAAHYRITELQAVGEAYQRQYHQARDRAAELEAERDPAAELREVQP